MKEISFQKLLNFINKDIEAQDESKTLAILIRSSSLRLAAAPLALSIGVIAGGHYALSCIFLLLMAVFCLIFYLTYHGSIFRTLVVLNAGVMCLMIGATTLFSWISGFRPYVYFIILVYFFYTKTSLEKQLAAVGGNILILFVLAFLFYGREEGPLGNPTYIFLINLITQPALFMAVGASFASKFARTEYKLYQYNLQLKKLAGSDPLTGLMNRRNMLDIIGELLPKMARGDEMLSVAIGDIDFFKKVNDSRGHDCGDYVLTELSKLFESFMETDNKGYVARWGGEEFLFVFTSGNGDNAFVELEDLRNRVEKMVLEFAGHEFKITMTFGLEEHTVDWDIDETIKRADEKLYIGKESGRNKVVY